jgi:hypothetical protein
MEAASLVIAAARNNAEWCHLFCQARGVECVFEERRWYARSRTPPLYPDVVTLHAGLGVEAALVGVDRGRGCSVKDSFSDLDLDSAGFRVLFDAEWIVRSDPPAGGDSSWHAVATDVELAAWEAAWDDDPGEERFFPSGLLAEDGVAFLARYDADGISTGALANRSAAVVGLSNVFAAGLDLDTAYAEASAAAGAIWPGLPIVGYDHGDPLVAAHAAGFESIGALRIWVS